MGLLDGKFAIVTGAASPRGLGKATAMMFAEHGATVAVVRERSEQMLSERSALPRTSG